MTTSHLDYDYDFVPPPDAPVFTPTMEEFKDCVGYLDKIRPIWEQYGIAKIKPPDEWQPPFAVDVDKLTFTPRIQRLNELEAHTRIKLNFLDQVAKFWELQGSSLKIPIVEKRALDLYTLKKYVKAAGGMELVNKEKRWASVAAEMGYNPTNATKIGNILRSHYERILFPLDIFEKEDGATKVNVKDENLSPSENVASKTNNLQSRIIKTNQNDDKSRRKFDDSPEDVDSKAFSKELARLQFFGAGPKLSGVNSDQVKEKTRGVKLDFNYDPLAKYMCQNCGKGDSEEAMLLCDGCDDSFHTFCLTPPLAEIPKGDWRCPKCISVEVSKPVEAFGFEQAQKDYSLQSFGEMADQFKSDYFNMPVHLIPTSLLEKEYWRILDNIDEDVMVEYGADLHSMDIGSGFPTMKSSKNLAEEEMYINSDWNLNNMPVLSNSILKQIDVDITGMKVPWIYVGMCFSTFCWHVEDHWTPSVNYLHWGEPKTWYSVPAKYAERAEAVMRNSAKELFTAQPDLLHHIVTTMNPNVLQAHGIPVHRIDQYAGEFIITAPRAYHAGFNCGYNCAEAVNFALPDWLELGRRCVEHYSLMRRFCVFSHDELVCKMASQAESLTLPVAAAAYNDMLRMVEVEKEHRKQLLLGGVREAEREAFELLPEDERQCAVCKTTCFSSALTCHMGKEEQEIVCLRHFEKMEVEPSTLVLRYRYTLDELAIMLQGLKDRAESYDMWVAKVRNALEAKGNDRLQFQDLKDMYGEALTRKYPGSELLEALQLTVEEAEKCQTVVYQLCNSNQKARTRTRGVDAKYRLTVEELQLFANQLETLPAKVSQHEGVTELLENVAKFQVEAERMLESEHVTVEMLEKCLEMAESMDIDLPEIFRLRSKLEQVTWLEELEELIADPTEVTVIALRQLKESGDRLSGVKAIEVGLGRLKNLLITLEGWETKAAACLTTRPRLSLEEVENLVAEGEAVSTALPSLTSLKDACRKTREWWARAEALQKPENYPYLDTLEALVAKGRPLPIRLDPLAQLETQVAAARAWRERTARVFLKKSSSHSLLEVLSPRYVFSGQAAKKRKRINEDNCIQHPIFQNLSQLQLSDPQEIVNAFKQAEREELVAIKEVRERNRKNKDDSGQVMLECQLCCEQFEPGTVPFPKSKGEENRCLKDLKFLCPSCMRSRRPRLETILSLLVSLQKLTVRLPEGEALQCLTERAMAWQDRARTALATTELAAALTKLSIERIDNSSRDADSQDMADDHSVDLDDSDSESESSLPRKGRRQSSAGTGPVLNLATKTIFMLEELMMEGDLLEVSLDESKHIWRILQATPGRHSKEFPEQLEADLAAAREERKKEKMMKRLQGEDKEEREKRREKKRRKSEEKRRKKEEEGGATSEDDCSASNPTCKRPVGKQVHWVQCDGCQLWFHLYCIGLKPAQISEEEDFMCRTCKFKKRGKGSHREHSTYFSDNSDMDTE